MGEAYNLLLTLAAIGLLGGCGQPNLPTKPPLQLALDATVEIKGKAYPIGFTWSEENKVAWNEGLGWHTEWKSSHRACVRILDTNYAVAVWLPGVRDADVWNFHPTFALIERGDARFLRSYPALRIGEDRDGAFRLTRLTIERCSTLLAAKAMSRDEESLKADIATRRYGYLYGMFFEKEQWSRSQDLQRLLSTLKDVTPLGKPPAPGEAMPEIWRSFYRFNSRTAMMEKMDRHHFGFAFRGDSWTPLPDSGVYWYRERMREDSAPIWISFRGHRIDQQQHELLFDEVTQRLIVAWKYGLESL